MGDFRFRKKERISKKKTVSKLFEGGAKSFCIYPIRMVYTITDKNEAPASILITVPKRKFKKAVNRNRIKRQIRESYRIRKNKIKENSIKKNKNLIIGFIYIGSNIYPSKRIDQTIDSLLNYLIEKN